MELDVLFFGCLLGTGGGLIVGDAVVEMAERVAATTVATLTTSLVGVGEDMLPVQAVSRNKTRMGVKSNDFFIVSIILF
jgi:hypothetical protein